VRNACQTKQLNVLFVTLTVNIV